MVPKAIGCMKNLPTIVTGTRMGASGEIRFEIWVGMVYIPAIKGVSGTNKLNFSKGLW
jgi:hypothetical protein